MPTTIYRSDTLQVRLADRGSQSWVVTFDPFTDVESLDREAFAEEVLESRGMSAIHVVNRRNNWYQDPDWKEAIAAVRRALPPGIRVVTYGSSMGGYAALRFAELLGADLVLAISPQYSGAPHRVPFEDRWLVSTRAVRWQEALASPLPARTPAVIIYDPRDWRDARHVELIAREMPVRTISLPFAGHPAGTYLAECRLLSQLLTDAAAGTLDPAEIEREARLRRRASASYFINLALASRERAPTRAVDLARRATEVAPEAFYTWRTLGLALMHVKSEPEACTAIRRSVELCPGHPALLHDLSRALWAAGQRTDARQAASDAVEGGATRGDIHAWLALVSFAHGDLRGATRAIIGGGRFTTWANLAKLMVMDGCWMIGRRLRSAFSREARYG